MGYGLWVMGILMGLFFSFSFSLLSTIFRIIQIILFAFL